MTALLAKPVVVEEVSNLEPVLPLLQEVRENLFHSKTEDCPSIQDNVFISICKLLFRCVSQSTKIEPSLPQTADMCSECLQHSCLAVRQYTLQYIIDQKDLVNGISRVLINLAMTEVDEGILAMSYSALAKALQLQKGDYDELYKNAMQLLSGVYMRYT